MFGKADPYVLVKLGVEKIKSKTVSGCSYTCLTLFVYMFDTV